MSLQFNRLAITDGTRRKCCRAAHCPVVRFDIHRVTRNNADEAFPEASPVSQQSPSRSPASTRETNAGDDEPERAVVPSDSEEVGGPKGPEPTRYGDWEKNGRCIDF